MSVGEVGSDRQAGRSGTQVTTRTLLGIVVLGTILYVFVGRVRWSEIKSDAAAKATQDDAISQLAQAEQHGVQRDHDLQSIRERLASPDSLNDQQVQDMLQRLQNFETGANERSAGATSLTAAAEELQGDRARNRVRLIEAYDIGRRTETGLASMEEQLAQLTGAFAAMGTSDLGRRIAARDDLVQEYEALAALKVGSFDDIDRWRRQLNALFPRIKLAHEDDQVHATVTQEDIASLRSLETAVSTALEQLMRQQRALSLIEATAKRIDPSPKQLAEVLAERQRERDESYRRQLVETTAAAVREVDAQYAEKIAEEQRRQRELLKQQELEAEKLQTNQRSQELEAIQRQRAELDERIARQKLEDEYRRDMPTINSLLAPFLDNAITQPEGGNPIAKGGVLRPTSLG
ncbi:MAG: hypothetical protein KDA51_00025, partial [Planctomycetales bacterium]|nr:hypothetical protein [Planctomycetales bacterium]